MTPTGFLTLAGPAFFGMVVGWVTYRTLRRSSAPVDLKDVAAVVGVVGGGVVTSLFGEPALFGSYSLGLAVGFFAYLAVAVRAFRGRLAAMRAELDRLQAVAPGAQPTESPILKELRERDPDGWMNVARRPAADDED